MTLIEQREDSRRGYALAIEELRRRAMAECRGEPLTPREIEAALRRAAG